MTIRYILVPYHLGRPGIGSAKGPLCFLKKGRKVVSVKIKKDDDENRAVAKVNARLAEAVAKTVKEGDIPFVISGNCNAALGMMAGLKSSKIGVIWFDAHGDFNTGKTTPSGYFDGMPLAILTGHCHQMLLKKIGLAKPLPESSALLIGLQNLDPKEKTALENSRVGAVSLKEIRKKGIEKSLLPLLKKLKSKVSGIYLHFDIDVLAPKLSPGVDFRCRDGLTLKEVKRAFKVIAKFFPIKAFSLTCYNPEKDVSDKTLKSGMKLLNILYRTVPGTSR